MNIIKIISFVFLSFFTMTIAYPTCSLGGSGSNFCSCWSYADHGGIDNYYLCASEVRNGGKIRINKVLGGDLFPDSEGVSTTEVWVEQQKTSVKNWEINSGNTLTSSPLTKAEGNRDFDAHRNGHSYYIDLTFQPISGVVDPNVPIVVNVWAKRKKRIGCVCALGVCVSTCERTDCEKILRQARIFIRDDYDPKYTLSFPSYVKKGFGNQYLTAPWVTNSGNDNKEIRKYKYSFKRYDQDGNFLDDYASREINFNQNVPFNHLVEQYGRYDFDVSLYIDCNNKWIDLPTAKINVFPSCYEDNEQDLVFAPADMSSIEAFNNDLDNCKLSCYHEYQVCVSNSKSIFDNIYCNLYFQSCARRCNSSFTHPTLLSYENGGYLINKGETYGLIINGITDFDENYNLEWDVGSAGVLDVENKTFQVNAAIGSFRIRAIPKYPHICLSPQEIKLFVGGKDQEIVISESKPVTLPGDLPDLGLEDGDFSYFNVSISSAQNIVVKPGLKLTSGSRLSIRSTASPDNTDTDYSFVKSTSRDEYNQYIAQTKEFFNESGYSIQTQVAQLSGDEQDKNGYILAQQPLYDYLGRSVLSTLSAPIKSYPIENSKGKKVNEHGEVPFEYKETFISSNGSNAYDPSNFDGNRLGNPTALNTTKPNTLGWYYSDQNNIEEGVGYTHYPFSQLEYKEDDLGEVKAVVNAGDSYRSELGHQHSPSTIVEKVNLTEGEDQQYLTQYLTIRNKLFDDNYTLDNIAQKVVKQKIITTEGLETINYSAGDQQWVTIVKSDPVLKKFQFYDLRERPVFILSPRGVKQYEEGSSLDDTDHAAYTYDYKGNLTSKTSLDKGITRYIYRQDGILRFSQSAKQLANGGRFSFSNYDASLRPIRTGVLDPSGTGFTFDSEVLESILENTSRDGGLPTTANIVEEVQTYYDLPDPSAPITQNFVVGSISYTKKLSKGNMVSTTWYSYDEWGRVIQWARKYHDIDKVFTQSYEYNATGNVGLISYNAGEVDAFYHAYEYDRDGRIKNAYAQKTPIAYDVANGVVTNLPNKHASYDYYIHGPIKSVTLGDNVQKMDYRYTVEGWLKSINHFDPSEVADIDNDKTPDVFGMTMEYYKGDYKNKYVNPVDELYQQAAAKGQYDGTVAAITSRHQNSTANAYQYEYDDNKRLKNADYSEITGQSGNRTIDKGSEFQLEDVSYDVNGNIEGFTRRDENGGILHNFKDKFVYDDNTNQLKEVKGYAKYEYNVIGELVHIDHLINDKFDQFFTYNSQGLITGVYTDAVHDFAKYTYTYDEYGFRISEKDHQNNVETWYMRDPEGVLLSIYSKVGINGDVVQTEVPIYGSERLGMLNAQSDQMAYEIKDHQGSVRAVISDKTDADGVAMVTYSVDYYPFGYVLRQEGAKHRFGFQGEYAEDETEKTGYNTFEARLYDPVIGRWVSTDPADQFSSPYTAFGNMPQTSVDPDGRIAWFIPVIGAVVGGVAGGYISSGTLDVTKWSGQDWISAGVGAAIGASITTSIAMTDVTFKAKFTPKILDVIGKKSYTYAKNTYLKIENLDLIFKIIKGDFEEVGEALFTQTVSGSTSFMFSLLGKNRFMSAGANVTKNLLNDYVFNLSSINEVDVSYDFISPFVSNLTSRLLPEVINNRGYYLSLIHI